MYLFVSRSINIQKNGRVNDIIVKANKSLKLKTEPIILIKTTNIIMFI